MKFRVALMATLINLVVCMLMLFFYASIAKNTQNELIEEELRVTCRLSAEILKDSTAFSSAGEEVLIGQINESGALTDMYVTYIENGEVTYTNYEVSRSDYLAQIIADSTKPFGVSVIADSSRICAVCPLGDGRAIALSKPSASLFSFSGLDLLAYFVMIAIAIAAQFLIILRYVGKSDKLIKELMGVLEDFTEGRFSSRITNVKGFRPELTAEYNAVLARVQDRVFRQARRNRVLGQMLNQMHNGLLTVDTNLNIQFTTSNVGKLFGRDIKNAEGRSLLSVLDNEDIARAVSEAINSGDHSVFTSETEGYTPTGSVRPLKLYTSTMFSEGKCTGALVVIEDITEMKKLEQIRTDFAANVSHEMKTPLTSIKGFIETLQSGAVDNPEVARRFLDIMMLEAERLTRLINDILSITKLESGTDNVEIIRLDIMGVIRHVAQLLKPQADAKNVSIIVHHPDSSAYVMGNRDRVQQLVLNLVENAVKYNKQDGTVRVSVYDDGTNINMIVADTGIGIKESDINRLFERFYRVDKGRSREMGGTGLGLAICKHIVKTMDGHIEVNSKYGEGTEFLVTLKRAPDEELQADDMNDGEYDMDDSPSQVAPSDNNIQG